MALNNNSRGYTPEAVRSMCVIANTMAEAMKENRRYAQGSVTEIFNSGLIRAYKNALYVLRIFGRP